MDDFEASETVKGKIEENKEEEGFNFMEILKNPMVGQLMESGKELFKKKEANPDTCEITVKAPSEVVLKLFRV